ncbi:MAG: ABC transporter substrate-binding protein [Flavobacteriales bacterium]|nr:ABC transporter substrate-binding protein [Flavobacteriales bacterium]
MQIVRDQMNRKIQIPIHSKRIISIVPSQTELLHDLGLGERVVGITKFCIHPTSWYQSKTRIGGTKQLNFEKIDSLKPDLIIGNKEENDETQVKLLMDKYPVWMSDISTLNQAYSMISSIGEITNTIEKSDAIFSTIKQQFSNLIPSFQPHKTLYLIWKTPYMAGGMNTFIDCVLATCGLVNIVERERYPELTNKEIQRINPELILLSSEPYPFKEKHIEELQQLVPKAKIKLVDGEMFSWYGSRLLEAPQYFHQLLTEI